MRIGVPRETKDGERRVGIVPEGARRLVARGHRLLVETGTGDAAGFSDADYLHAGATRLRELAEALERTGSPIDAWQLEQSRQRFDDAAAQADAVIGAVLQPGKSSPKLVTRALRMRPGSALVDVGIDQGGIGETSRPTTLSDPTFVEHGVVHYAVPNMPALVARTATLALCRATLPYVECLAEIGIREAMQQHPELGAGLMVQDGCVVHAGLAADAGLPLDRPQWRRRPTAAH